MEPTPKPGAEATLAAAKKKAQEAEQVAKEAVRAAGAARASASSG